MNIAHSHQVASPTPTPSGDLLSSSARGSPALTDIQDTQSSHSDQQQQQQHHAPSLVSSSDYHQVNHVNVQHHHQHDDSQRKNLKTEYKSNFKPFNQYVYNEVTDQFVEQKNTNNLLVEANDPKSLSNQDLAANSSVNVDVYAHSSISPALEMGSFEPSTGADHHYDVTKEPWYKEVVKRNEKANEYRFKSEVGHNSLLLKDAASANDDELGRRIGEFNHDDQHRAVDSNTTANNDPGELTSKRSYKFTPNDYKRDHLIATMANNNNFNLPKEHESAAGNKLIAGHRAPPTCATRASTTSTARSTARTTSSSRARSQSSRRQIATSATSTSASSRQEHASKSNQTTPVKSATPRVSSTTTRTSLLTARTTTRAPTNGTSTTSATRTSTTRTSVPTTNGSTRPSTSTRRLPGSTTASKTTTPRLTGSSAASSTRPTTAAIRSTATTRTSAATPASSRLSASRTATMSKTANISMSDQSTTSRFPAKRATPVSRTTTRPTTAAPARNSPSRASNSSRSGSTSTASNTTSNAPKSIKSKALADAGEKAAAAAAAALTAAGATGLAVSGDGLEVDTSSTMESKDLIGSSAQSSDPEPAPISAAAAEQIDTQVSENYNFNQEPNLIITTTESGNMLADEIARAEREAQENVLQSQQDEQVQLLSIANEVLKESGQTVGGQDELINGMTGGITSAEDRYDSSERDTSVDYEAQQAGQVPGSSNDDNDEPYSIMPTTFNAARQEEQFEAIQQYTDKTFEQKSSNTIENGHDLEVSETENVEQSKEVPMQYGMGVDNPCKETTELGDKLPLEQEKQVEFDLTRSLTKSIASVEEPIVKDSELKLESSYAAGDDQAQNQEQQQMQAAEHEDEPGDVEDEPYVHLEPEPPIMQVEEPSEATPTPESPVIVTKDQIEMDKDHSTEEEFEIIEPEPVESEIPVFFDQEANRYNTDEPQIGKSETDDSENQVIQDNQKSGHVKIEEPESKDEEDKSDLEVKEVEDESKGKEDEKTISADEQSATEVPVEIDEPVFVKTVTHKLTDELDLFNADESHKGQPSVFAPRASDMTIVDTEIHNTSEQKEPKQEQQVEQQGNDDFGFSVNKEATSEDATSRFVDNVDHADDDVNRFATSETMANSELLDADDDELSARNELLMNVADLVDAETRMKQEMTRKSELARQQSNSRSSLPHAGEILLSADQLNEQFATQTTTSVKEEQATEATTAADYDGDRDSEQLATGASTSDERDIAQLTNEHKDENATNEDLVNFDSITSTREQLEQSNANNQKIDLMEPEQQHTTEATQLVNSEIEGDQLLKDLAQETKQDETALFDNFVDSLEDKNQITKDDIDDDSTMNENLHRTNLPDDDLMVGAGVDEDDEEQLKLSNHLTNSDDDVILAPRNNKEALAASTITSQKPASRYNEGAGLSVMNQQQAEDEEIGPLELADGSSAELDAPAMLPGAKLSMMPELGVGATPVVMPQALASHRANADSDDEDIGLNPNADPLDVAATLSPSSSVAAEEMLRLSRQASNASLTGKLLDESLALASARTYTLEQTSSTDHGETLLQHGGDSRDADTYVTIGHQSNELDGNRDSNRTTNIINNNNDALVSDGNAVGSNVDGGTSARNNFRKLSFDLNASVVGSTENEGDTISDRNSDVASDQQMATAGEPIIEEHKNVAI